MDIPSDKPVALRVPLGSTVTFLNSDPATDVYISRKRQELLAKFPQDAATIVPHTTAAPNPTVVQWPAFEGVVWLRANGALVTKFEASY